MRILKKEVNLDVKVVKRWQIYKSLKKLKLEAKKIVKSSYKSSIQRSKG